MQSCVSSAYKWKETGMLLKIKLIGEVQSEKRRGPRTEPWGTPVVRGIGLEDWLSMVTC